MNIASATAYVLLSIPYPPQVGDRRIIRLIKKWLKAGILEDGIVSVDDTA